MRAGFLIGLNEFEIREMDVPQCHQNEVIVKVEASGICGSDIHKMSKGWKYKLPMIMGHEMAGTIVKVGRSVHHLKKDDRVAVVPFIPCRNCAYCAIGKYQLCTDYIMMGSQRFGGFAEYVSVPASNIVKIGTKLSFEEAAMIEPLAVSAHGVYGIEPKVGDVVAVFGLGTIGLLTIQWLEIAGVKTIIGIDIQSEKLEQAIDLGVTDTINPSLQDLETEISRITDGLGVDIAMECAGTKITEEQCLLVTKKGGKIGFQGIAYSDVLIRQRAFEKIFRSELTIKGFWNSYSAPFPGKEWFDSITFLESGRLSVSHMISHRFPLEDLQRAFDLAVNRSESFNKIMIML